MFEDGADYSGKATVVASIDFGSLWGILLIPQAHIKG